MEKKDEKNTILEEKTPKKWKILINNEINYYETDDKKLTDLDAAKLFMQKNNK